MWFLVLYSMMLSFFFFQAEDGIRDDLVTGVQTCALPISGLPAIAHTATTYAASRTIESASVALSRPEPLPSRSRYTPAPPATSDTRRSRAPRSGRAGRLPSTSG